MQTKEQIIEKIDELIEDSVSEMKKHINQVLKGGSINLDKYENNWLLPKLLMSAAHERMARDYEPPKANRKIRKELKNIKCHL